MFADISIVTGMRAQLQSISLGSLCALSGLDITGATLTLGISEELVSKAVSALGISNTPATFSEKEIELIKEWIKTLPIDTTLSYHVLREKHALLKNVDQNVFYI